MGTPLKGVCIVGSHCQPFCFQNWVERPLQERIVIAVDPEDGIEVSEEYGPIYSDDETLLWVEEQSPKPLNGVVQVRPEQSHQLLREQPGFSPHPLRMTSVNYRFPSRNGHIRCNRLRQQDPMLP